MCPVIQTRSISMMKLIKDEPAEETKPAAQKPPAPKSRKKKSSSRVAKKKRRKPKFLSLRSSRLSVRNDAVSADDDDDVDAAGAKKEELELFPLRPEMMTHDDVSDDDVAMLFESDGGATLQGLLMSAETATLASTVSSESNYGFVPGDGDVDIVRTAMRGRSGGDRSSEKWVCYSELVKEEVDLTATATTSSASAASTCCSVGADDRKAPHRDQRQLALKLDYVEVLNAWSDKGSLFIKTEDGESPPQTVPDLLQDQLFHHLHDSNANIEDLWRVPEERDGLASKKMQRQESLLRYKRKRESRLFSKQIRYEVRKLNAEKRPRVKGRFVRKS